MFEPAYIAMNFINVCIWLALIAIFILGFMFRRSKKKPKSTFHTLKTFPLHRPAVVRLLLGLILYTLICSIIFSSHHLFPQSILFLITTSCVSVLLILFFFPTVTLMGESMQPTLLSGDAIIGERISKFMHRPFKRGDIISFRVGKEMLRFIPAAFLETISEFSTFPKLTLRIHGIHINKRIVGLPGERIAIKEGQLYIDDQPMKETWATGLKFELKQLKDIGYTDYNPFPNSEELIVVPNDHYFVLGDNSLPNNIDSHVFGFVSYKSIKTRQKAIIWRNGAFYFAKLL